MSFPSYPATSFQWPQNRNSCCFSFYLNLFAYKKTSLTAEKRSGTCQNVLPPCYRRQLPARRSVPLLQGAAPVTVRLRPALFRRETPGPVQRSASAGSHQPPALFRGSCSVFFPSQSFAKIKDIVPALPGFVNPGFPGKFPSPAAKMLTKQPPALIIRKIPGAFPL